MREGRTYQNRSIAGRSRKPLFRRRHGTLMLTGESICEDGEERGLGPQKRGRGV